MNTRISKASLILGSLALALLPLPGALAQCGLGAKSLKPSGLQMDRRSALPNLVLAAWADRDSNEPIVGMWHEVFTAKTSNGSAIPDTVVDNALAVWHSDRTEIMNSVRSPQDGNFCLGVWEQTGPLQYHLNHFAWFANAFPNSNPSGIGDPVGPTRFIEDVTVDRNGTHFTGTFQLIAHDTAGKITQRFTGVMTGARITTKTTTPDLL